MKQDIRSQSTCDASINCTYVVQGWCIVVQYDHQAGKNMCFLCFCLDLTLLLAREQSLHPVLLQSFAYSLPLSTLPFIPIVLPKKFFVVPNRSWSLIQRQPYIKFTQAGPITMKVQSNAFPDFPFLPQDQNTTATHLIVDFILLIAVSSKKEKRSIGNSTTQFCQFLNSTHFCLHPSQLPDVSAERWLVARADKQQRKRSRYGVN